MDDHASRPAARAPPRRRRGDRRRPRARPTRLLAARRTEPPALAGGWELPGGKVDPGESPLSGAAPRAPPRSSACGSSWARSVPGPQWAAAGRWATAYLMRVWLARGRAGRAAAPIEDHDELRWLGRADAGCAVGWLPADLPIVRRRSRRACGARRRSSRPPASARVRLRSRATPKPESTVHHAHEAPATTCATSPSSPTSTTARPPSSTPCSGSPAPSARTQRRRRARDGLQRPGAREGHHDPREEHRGAAPRRRTAATRHDQHHRHPRPRRLRRRGRARPVDGRRRRAARRRLRGPAAADPLRAAQGARRRSCRSSSFNKVDRPDARIAEVVDETYELFLDLDADEDQIEFPIVYASAKAGRASLDRPEDGDDARTATTSSRCSTRSSSTDPGARRTTTRRRCRRTSPTSTPRLPRPARAAAASTTARSARASRSPGAARDGTHRSGSRSPSC